MNVLIACEFSGIVRDAFIQKGHNAISCDLEPSERPGPHHEGMVEDLFDINNHWDMVIAFPPCTHLCSSGARWWKDKDPALQANAIAFAMYFESIADKVCVENPIGKLSTAWRKPDQIIQPWMFGHGETKATCLWLKGLPPLEPTDIVEGREARVHKMSPGPDRPKERSRTMAGVARAMAEQWG